MSSLSKFGLRWVLPEHVTAASADLDSTPRGLVVSGHGWKQTDTLAFGSSRAGAGMSGDEMMEPKR